MYNFLFSDTSFKVPAKHDTLKDTLATESSMDTEVNITDPSVLIIPAPKTGVDVYQLINMMMKISYFNVSQMYIGVN